METREKNLKLSFGEWLIFIYLALFPLGQLIRLTITFFGFKIPIHPTDILVFTAVPIFLFYRLKLPRVFTPILNFLTVATFSLLFSLAFLPAVNILVGTLYLVRFFAYTTFFLLIWVIVLRKKDLKEILFNSLILVCLFTALFGWIQYFWVPDLTSLKYLGWDDHLYRLVGTFLDPGFTGIILVFGFLACLTRFLKEKKTQLLILTLFFLISIAFTYSRASFLALLAGVFVLANLKKKAKIALVMVASFLIISLLLPRPGGEGVRLERVQSIYARGQNYWQTLTLIKNYPLFGVGFNNICLARTKAFAGIGSESHSCSGADSSLLLVTATTGIVGLIVFLFMAWKVLRRLTHNVYGQTFLATSWALFIHSLFVNSLFYPWVMGYLAVLAAISLKE